MNGNTAPNNGGGAIYQNSSTPLTLRNNTIVGNSSTVSLGGGYQHSVVLRGDGAVWTAGSDQNGQLGDGMAGTNSDVLVQVLVSSGGAQLSGIVQVSAGELHSVALTSSGDVFVWGYNLTGQVGDNTTNEMGCLCVDFPTQTTNSLMGTVTSIAAGVFHTAAINTAGNVYAWGAAVPEKSGTTTLQTRSSRAKP